MEPRTEAGKRLFARFWETPAKDADRIGQIVAGLQRDILAIEEEARTVNPEGLDVALVAKAMRTALNENESTVDWPNWLGGEGTAAAALAGINVARTFIAEYLRLTTPQEVVTE